jgi:hypothetical protein
MRRVCHMRVVPGKEEINLTMPAIGMRCRQIGRGCIIADSWGVAVGVWQRSCVRASSDQGSSEGMWKHETLTVESQRSHPQSTGGRENAVAVPDA